MSKNLYAMFGMDKAAETDGIVVNYGDVRFRIARAGGSNQKFKKVFQHKAKPFRRQIDNEQMSDEASDRMMAEVFAEAVILGWESLVTDEKGEKVLKDGKEQWEPVFNHPTDGKLAFTTENVTRVMLELPELFSDIRDMANKAANFRKAEDEADAGN